jgi:hypothetical protein
VWVWLAVRRTVPQGQLPSIELGVGFTTLIWRVPWPAPVGPDGAAAALRRTGSSAPEEGERLREEQRLRWCQCLAACDPRGALYHWVLMRHWESGRVSVYVDQCFEGNGSAQLASTELKFRVGDSVAALRVGFNEAKRLGYTYTLALINKDGSRELLKELNEVLVTDHDPEILHCDVPSARLERGGEEADRSRDGTAARGGGGGGGSGGSGGDGVAHVGGATSKGEHKMVAVYRVVARARGAPVEGFKRFSDFVELDRKVRSAFAGSHLLSSLPSLPPKSIKLLNDHTDAAFVEQRRQGLQHYMAKLVALPRIPLNPDVLEFLALLPAHAVSNAPPVVVV